MSEQYEEVISFTPTGDVLTFSNYSEAKKILLKQFHHFIIKDAQDLAARYTHEQLINICKVTLGATNRNRDAIPAAIHKEQLAVHMWPLLIERGRATKDYVKSKKTKGPQSEMYKGQIVICKYKPGANPNMDTAYRTMAPQARRIIDLCLAHMPDHGITDSQFYRLIMDNGDFLKTKQNPWRVYKYYQHRLISRGLLKIEQ